ncbi:MAG: ABC transporter permease [Chloroflexi bacterium]|nr:ABC transporter permease [Chloroflexota bacterium]
MGKYVVKRVLRGIVTLLGISIVVFVLTHIFGDPAIMLLPEDATKETLWFTRESLGLNDPLIIQFKNFALNALKGDFGPSIHQMESSRALLLRALPATGVLAAAALAVGGTIGVTIGILASMKPRSWLDNVVSTISMGGVSTPEFWVALLLIWVVAVQFGLLPTSGYGQWQHLILPAVVLSIRPTGRIAQVTRSSMLDEMSRQYTVTAYAKGLARRQVIRRHVLKNAGIGIVTMVGIEVADLLSGTIIVETIFAWPGVGFQAKRAFFSSDFPLIQTVVLWAALITVTMNLLVDLTYGWLNPRIRYA